MKFNEYLKRFLVLCAGFCLISIGVMLTVNANIGVAPWDCLYLGLSKITGLSFGRISQLFGITFVIVGLFFNILPGLGTLCDVLIIGILLDFIGAINLIQPAEVIAFKLLYLFLGIFILGCGISFYISAGFGTGPRDGLMVLLSNKFDISVWKIRMAMDLLAFIFGFALGGPVGIGTPLIAFGVGPTLQVVKNVLGIDIKNVEHRTIDKEIQIIKNYIKLIKIKRP